ncbi:hypothetical protein C2E25_00885 [Geothermobacter hydrogeniphilus]|uniref:Cytochrome c domain-containing protein n=2 Tax=Geothermobacter hydrogeniphilus TaxID=1969733 RepID=A0A2K2HEU8_9BACT|nr:hypothetical protein C2E25_00885 [Geothermobacter hydrogeniphilus]
MLLVMGWPARLPAGAVSSVTGEPTPLTKLEPHYRASVLRGWQSFQTSFAVDGVACVDCHLRLESLGRWAAAYPKVEVFDGSSYRVKSLRQVVLEALERHTDLPRARRIGLVEDLVAFLSWWGEGRVMQPGRSRLLPPPAADLALLRVAVRRGEDFVREHWIDGCGACHRLGDGRDPTRAPLDRAASRFPRFVPAAGGVVSLETFLAGHLRHSGNEEWSPECETVISLSAYLASLAEATTYLPGHPGDRSLEQADE